MYLLAIIGFHIEKINPHLTHLIPVQIRNPDIFASYGVASEHSKFILPSRKKNRREKVIKKSNCKQERKKRDGKLECAAKYLHLHMN